MGTQFYVRRPCPPGSCEPGCNCHVLELAVGVDELLPAELEDFLLHGTPDQRAEIKDWLGEPVWVVGGARGSMSPEQPSAALVLLEEPRELARPDLNPAAVYLASLGSPKSVRTMRGALATVAAELGAPSLEAVDWSALRYQHVAALRSRLSSRLAPASVNKVLSALRGVSREAMRLGILSAEDHARIADVAGVRGSRLPAGRHLDGAELEALFAATSSRPSATATLAGSPSCSPSNTAISSRRTSSSIARDAALLAVLRVGGLRRAELVTLDLEDLDRSAWTLRVLGKGNKERRAYVAEASVELEAWLGHRGDTPGPLFCAVSRSGKISLRRLAEASVARILAQLARRAGVARFSPHDLRRTLAGDLLDAGADVGAVQRLLGHAQVATTLRYDRRGDRAAEKAARLIKVPRSR